jgi:hypothetical protein
MQELPSELHSRSAGDKNSLLCGARKFVNLFIIQSQYSETNQCVLI